MNLKTLLAAAVAAAFALPFAALAQDKPAAGATAKPDGGAAAMFKSLDKDSDGYISKEEAKGTPHDKDFAMLDKDNDGKLSPEEHAAAPEHAGKAGTAATGGGAAATGGTMQGQDTKK